jgi:hypothetical protein
MQQCIVLSIIYDLKIRKKVASEKIFLFEHKKHYMFYNSFCFSLQEMMYFYNHRILKTMRLTYKTQAYEIEKSFFSSADPAAGIFDQSILHKGTARQ